VIKAENDWHNAGVKWQRIGRVHFHLSSINFALLVYFAICLFCVDNSAKVTESNEITPQSNYVNILSDGSCKWSPRFDQSVTQCHIDVTWFPFDTQTCHLIFESWLLPESILKVTTHNDRVSLEKFLRPEGWYLSGMFRLCAITTVRSIVDYYVTQGSTVRLICVQ